MASRYTPKGLKRVIKALPEQPQLIVKSTGKPYMGTDYFYDPIKEAYFTGKPSDPVLTQDELLEGFSEVEGGDAQSRYVEPLLYDKIKGDSLGYDIRATKQIPTTSGQPTEEDLVRGVYERYFTQHNTTGKVSEIAEEDYIKLLNKSKEYHYPSYTVGKTLWRLKGPVANQTINGYIVQGAEEVNVIFIQILQRQLPNIRTYLTDPTQFVK